MANTHISEWVLKWHPSHGKHKAGGPGIRWDDSVSKDLSECDLDILSAETVALDKPG